MIFCHPNERDLTTARELLRTFGAASGLHNNLTKWSALPIQCAQKAQGLHHRHLSMPDPRVPDAVPWPTSFHPQNLHLCLTTLVDKLEQKLSFARHPCSPMPRGLRWCAMFSALCPPAFVGDVDQRHHLEANLPACSCFPLAWTEDSQRWTLLSRLGKVC